MWRIDTHNAVKIKNRYFTPQILEAEPNRDFKFDVEISLDNQTLLLVESNNDTDNCMVLIFDLYTLDKVCEMDVNVCNDLIKEEENYDEDSDKFYPEDAEYYATAPDFCKIQNWNGGEYILVAVGAEPTSKVFYEFRVYNSSTKKLIGTFHRQFHEDMEGLLLEVEFHKEDPDSLIFLMVDEGTTMIVEAEILHNRSERVATIICEDLEHLRIAEDLTTVYFIRRLNSDSGNNGFVLDTIEYGKDIDVSAHPNKYTKFLGVEVEKTAILNDSLVVYYYKNDDSGMISVFTGKEEVMTIEPSFQNASIDSFSFIEKTGELLCFLDEYVDSK